MEQQWITIFNIIVGIGLLLYLLRCWQRGFAGSSGRMATAWLPLSPRIWR